MTASRLGAKSTRENLRAGASRPRGNDLELATRCDEHDGRPRQHQYSEVHSATQFLADYRPKTNLTDPAAPVAGDVTERTIDADDAMVIEERQRDAAAGAGGDAGQRRTRQAELARGGVAGEAASGGTAADVAQGEDDSGLGDDSTLHDLGAFGVFG